MLISRGKAIFKKRRESSVHFTKYLIDEKYGLYTEEYFNKRLSFETKRTERSRKPFLMMLLNIEKISEVDEGKQDVMKIKSVLFSSVRGTDLKGWYRYHSVIGVLFTEMNGIDKNLIKKKIYHALCDDLGLDQANSIEITFLVFPEECNDQKHDGPLNLNFYPDLSKRNSSKGKALFMKRAMDIVGSVFGLILFFPVFLIVPVLIKLLSKGPVLYRQERIGLQGKKFTFLKFRSMVVDNDPGIHREYTKNLINRQKSHDNDKNAVAGAAQGGVYKITNDPRITFIGRILRITSLDEFPQFINVLRGEMSLVGPRPPIQYELDNYDIWHRRRVLEVKPGITGLWQVKGRSSTTFDEMVRLDLKYVRKWSLWLDFKILIQTPWVIIVGKGAY